MNILVIGSKGFIGSNIFEYFARLKNNSVFGCDILPNLDNSENYFYTDKNNPDYEILFKNHQFDVSINASGLGDVSQSLERPLVDFQLNTFNVYKILDAVRLSNKNCKFVNLSSAAVYGNPETLPITEGHHVKPISPYGWHKEMSESICKEFFHLFKIQTISLRIFSAYGPGLKKQIFWDIFQKGKMNVKEITLFGTGRETRDFIYIDDICKAVDIIINNANFNGESYNVASGVETEIATAASLLVKNHFLNTKIVFNGEVKEGNPLYWKADIQKLNNIGFQNQTTIEEGLLKYSEWIRKQNL